MMNLTPPRRGKRTRGEMDITTVFGTVIVGSNPAGCTASCRQRQEYTSDGKIEDRSVERFSIFESSR